MRKKFLLLLLLLSLFKVNYSQSTTCSNAVIQLQNYATQVNQIYNFEYWNAIPNQRCPAYDQWGRPFNPQIVQNCRLQMLGYLNQWYGQQCSYVNSTYATIMRGCIVNSSQQSGPAPQPINGGNENVQINTTKIKELTAGVDEDKAVKITIPSTPSGFKPR